MKPVILKHKDKDGVEHETPYYMVKDRIKEFRKDHKEWPVITNLERMEGGQVVFSCKIYNLKDQVIATGWAWESVSSGYINKYSAVENCETSSIGRALANLGYGGDGEYASYEEMQKQVDDKTKEHLFDLLRTSTFNEDQKEYYEARIKNCTIIQVSDLFDTMNFNQLDPITEKGTGNQGDIQKRLDLKENE